MRIHQIEDEVEPRPRLANWFFGALLYFLFCQFAVIQSEESGNTLCVYHLLVMGPLAVSLLRIRELRFTVEVAFFATLVLTSALGYLKYGLNVRAILLVFALAAFVSGRRFVATVDSDTRLVIYRYVFYGILATTVLRNIVYRDSLSLIYGRSASNEVWFLATGGPNLESSHLGMATALLSTSSWFLFAFVFAGLTSVLMLSRSGIIAASAASSQWIFAGRRSAARIGLMLICLVVLTGYGLKLTSSGYEDKVSRRFNLSTEKDLAAENQGRLAIWKSSAKFLMRNPWGHGSGNGFAMMNEELSRSYRENNSHNIYLDIAMDGGIQSLLLLGCIALINLRKAFTENDPLPRVALIYCLLACFQFTGYDAIGWFFIGASSGVRLCTQHGVEEEEVFHEPDLELGEDWDECEQMSAEPEPSDGDLGDDYFKVA